MLESINTRTLSYLGWSHTVCCYFFGRSFELNENMNRVMADKYPPFSLEKPRYSQVSCYIALACTVVLIVLCMIC